MENLSIGQVVLAAFPFSDLTSKKLRPCLIVGVAEFNDVVLCQITSQQYGSKRAVGLGADDFKIGTIVQHSYIRPDKLATLDKKMVKQILGVVTTTKLTDVKNALKTFFEIA